MSNDREMDMVERALDVVDQLRATVVLQKKTLTDQVDTIKRLLLLCDNQNDLMKQQSAKIIELRTKLAGKGEAKDS